MSPSWTSSSSALAGDRSSVVGSWSASAACNVSDTFSPLQNSSASATLPALLPSGLGRRQTRCLGGRVATAVDGAAVGRRARTVGTGLAALVRWLLVHRLRVSRLRGLLRGVGGIGRIARLHRLAHLLHRLLPRLGREIVALLHLLGLGLGLVPVDPVIDEVLLPERPGVVAQPVEQQTDLQEGAEREHAEREQVEGQL